MADPQPTIIATEMWVPASIEAVWNFFANPKNLEKITPAWFGASVLSDTLTINGAQVEITLNPLGFPANFRWTAEYQDVVDVGPQRQFVDIQVKGPFTHWKHTHLFEEGAHTVQGERSGAKIKAHSAGTWIKDILEYVPPLSGIIGQSTNTLLIERSLQKMFTHRRKRLQEIFI